MTRVICNGLTDKNVGPGVCCRSERKKYGWTEDGHMTRVICNGLTDKNVGPGVCSRSERNK